jgi:uncharacterized membrane protein HdeD (DUF308 family)
MTAMQMTTKVRPWWLLLVNGILAVLIGGILLWSPVKTKANTYMLLVSVLGFYWLFRGIFEIVHLFVDRSAWGWKLFMGIVGIMAGSYVLMYPVAAGVILPKTFVLVLGIWGLIEGVVLLIMAFNGGGWGAGILGGLAIIFGIALMVNYSTPGMGLSFLWVASIFAVVGGVFMIIQSFRERSLVSSSPAPVAEESEPTVAKSKAK